MKPTLKFTLKAWITSVVLTPVILILLLWMLPSYQIPDIIGFVFLMYVLPCTLLLSLTNSMIMYFILVIAGKLIAGHIFIAKLCLCILSLLIGYLCFCLLYREDTAIIYNDNYLLATAYIIAIIISIWIFKLSSGEKVAVVGTEG